MREASIGGGRTRTDEHAVRAHEVGAERAVERELLSEMLLACSRLLLFKCHSTQHSRNNARAICAMARSREIGLP
jgi:hypothetical protein